MLRLKPIRTLFGIAAIYDGLLGLAFLFAGPAIFETVALTPPNHWGYIHFPALLLMVFALMFAAVSRDPQGNRNLIPFGILLKASYCGVVFWHWASAGLPDLWKPWAFADFVFLLLFAWAWSHLGRQRLAEA